MTLGNPLSLFVVVEGVDGAGTTTQVKLAGDALVARGYRVHRTREPSDLVIGKHLRSILGGGQAAHHERSLALLFAADRLQHYEDEIAPALRRGEIVLSDRYVLSSLVYQGEQLGDDPWVHEINRFAPPPDLTVLLDVPAEVAAKRRQARGGSVERYDDDELQRRLVQRYRARMRGGANQLVLSGELPAAELAERISMAIVERMQA